MRVIGSQSEQLGVLTIEQALAKAAEEGLDLVEVSPMAKPPVCKIMDYGKFKYEAKKKANEAKKKQAVVHLKEVKMRPKTEDHDYDFKVKNIRRFLEEGDKARVTIMFRGREITHREIGQKLLQDVLGDLKDIAVVEQAPRMEGRQMFMILAASPRTKAQLQQQARSSAPAQSRPPSAPQARPASAPQPGAAPAPRAPEAEAKPAPAPAPAPES